VAVGALPPSQALCGQMTGGLRASRRERLAATPRPFSPTSGLNGRQHQVVESLGVIGQCRNTGPHSSNQGGSALQAAVGSMRQGGAGQARHPANQQQVCNMTNGTNGLDKCRMSRREFFKAAGLVWVAAGPALNGRPAELAQPPRWQIGCYTRPWDQYDYRVALDGIAEAGYRYAGLMTAKGKSWIIITCDTPAEEAARIGAEARQRGLTVVSLYGGDPPVARSLQAGIEGLKRLIDNCVACGATNLLLGGTADAKLQADYYKAVAACCEYAASKGIGLSLKPHGGLNATGPQCRQIIESVGHPNFRLWYDPGNIFYYSQGKLDPVEDVATVDGLVVGMSVKDFRPPNNVMVTPGTGQVQWRKLMDRLQQGGFKRGPLLVECVERGDPAKITAEARKARLFLEELTGQKA